MKGRIIFLVLFFISCDDNNTSKKGAGATYIPATINKYGKFRKASVRFPVSAKKNALKNKNRSSYYYQTRTKYRRK